jgi:sterol desaturase/sphingolipid hydroxylase (fatty acid hydroxylase superfamily)
MDTNRISNAESDVGTLIKGAFQDVEKLAEQHIKLFKKELSDDVTQAAEGFVSLIIGLNVLFVGAVLLAFALAHGLMQATRMDPWLAYLIVGVLVCIGGGVALFLAQNRLKEASKGTPKTAEELEEDAKWLTNPK